MATEEKIKFTSFYKPTLESETYSITAKQELTKAGFETHTETLNELKFTVRSPQFSIHPGEIHSFFPPQGIVGNYSNNLPHIVLNKRVLPWERTIGDSSSPWMALLTFTEDEVSEVRSMSIEDYLKPEDNVIIPGYVLPIEKDELCQSFEVPLNIFNKVAPKLTEIPFLAHCRQVDVSNKVEMETHVKGLFSVLVSNRLPKNGRKHVVHLVSLEKCKKLLEDIKDRKTIETEKRSLRLISLANWTFENKEKGTSLWDKVNTLISPEDLHLRMPIDPEKPILNPKLKLRLKQGFIPLPFHLLTGEDSVAWYRGPFTPSPVGPLENDFFSNAAESMIFDQEGGGIFDQTYSSAWQLGRMLALSNGNINLTLVDFRTKLNGLLDTFYDRLSEFGNFMVNEYSRQTGVPEDHLRQFLTTPFKNLLETSFQSDETFVEMLLSESIIEHTLEKKTDKKFAEDFLASLEEENKYIEESIEPSAISKSENSLIGYQEFIDNWEVLEFGNTTVKSKLLEAEKSTFRLYASQLKKHIAKVLKPELSKIFQWLNKVNPDDIPFYYLIPHPSLLPKESFRFFHVDPNWWRSLAEGVLSLGVNTSLDHFGAKIIKKIADGDDDISEFKYLDRGKQWGIFIRSAVVKSWQGLEFYAFDSNDTSLEPIFHKRISDDILLFLFEKRPTRLEIREPKEGLNFGVTEDEDKKIVKTKNERGDDESFGLPMNQETNVIDVEALTVEIGKLGGNSNDSASLAKHMIDAPNHLKLTIKS